MTGVSAAADRALLATPTRQSPVAVVFIAWRFFRNLGVVNIGVAFFFLLSGRLSVALLAVGMLAAVVGLVATLLAWWRFVFTVDGGELLVSKGVVSQERLTIPLDRVQSVSINQKFFHRLIGLVSVLVDTAGSSSTELEIDAVDRRRAEALQRLAAGEHATDGAGVAGAVGPAGVAAVPGPGPAGAASAVAEAEQVLVARTPLELVKIGASSWPWAGLVALAPLVAFVDDLGEVVPIDVDGERLVEDNLPSEVGGRLILALAAIGLAVLVTWGLLGALLQVVRSLVRDWDLQLTRTATGLRRTAGLLSTTSKASTVNRIQAVQTDETPMQRAFGILRLTLPTIGEGDLGIPGVTGDELSRIRGEVFDRGEEPILDRRISRWYIFLAVRNQLLLALLVAAVLYPTLGRWGLLALGLVPGRWLVARRRWRLRRWGVSADRIAEAYEFLNRHTAEIELIKAQTVTVRRSFFERRRGLASVRIETAEGYLAVPLIPLAEAEAVRDRTLHRLESDHRAWM